jgi:hypothetical protein
MNFRLAAKKFAQVPPTLAPPGRFARHGRVSRFNERGIDHLRKVLLVEAVSQPGFERARL